MEKKSIRDIISAYKLLGDKCRRVLEMFKGDDRFTRYDGFYPDGDIVRIYYYNSWVSCQNHIVVPIDVLEQGEDACVEFLRKDDPNYVKAKLDKVTEENKRLKEQMAELTKHAEQK
jgi:hypothetical protein